MIEADRSSSSDSSEDQVSQEEEGEEVKEQSKGKEVVNNGRYRQNVHTSQTIICSYNRGMWDVASGHAYTERENRS